MTRPFGGRRRRLVVGVVALAGVLGACAQWDAVDDLPPFQLTLERRAETLSLDAPTWVSEQTLLVLCPTEPVTESRPLSPNENVQLDRQCVVYGRYPSPEGLEASLGLGQIDADRRPTFDAAVNWWLVMIGLTGERATSIYTMVVEGGPIAPQVTPGPSASVSPSASASVSPSASAPASPDSSPAGSPALGP